MTCWNSSCIILLFEYPLLKTSLYGRDYKVNAGYATNVPNRALGGKEAALRSGRDCRWINWKKRYECQDGALKKSAGSSTATRLLPKSAHTESNGNKKNTERKLSSSLLHQGLKVPMISKPPSSLPHSDIIRSSVPLDTVSLSLSSHSDDTKTPLDGEALSLLNYSSHGSSNNSKHTGGNESLPLIHRTVTAASMSSK